MKLIEQNPFRMLGIPVNATAKDLAANKGKMRLLDIGKEVSFPLDLPDLLPPVSRTKETVAEAECSINLPHDKLKHALFWFAQPTDPIGKLGYDHLLQGMNDSAIEKLQRSSSWEAKLSLATFRLQQGCYSMALTLIGDMIDERCNEFVHAVAGQTHNEEADTLRHEYLVRLSEEVSAIDLLAYDNIPDTMLSELRSIAIDMPLADIEKEVAAAKALSDKDAAAQLKAGRDLMSKTKAPLQQLRTIAASNPRYSRTADKLANQILQCSINYHNAIDNDPNKQVTAAVIDTCLNMAKYAESIAVGKMAKDHIKHNLDILKEKKAKLPPAGLEKHDTAIKTSIITHIVIGGQTIDNAIALMKDCAPHIVAIKERQEADTSLRNYYLNISTQVVNAALSSIIEEHNKVMNAAQRSANSVLGVESVMWKVQNVLKKAWKATLMMDKFDKEEAFKEGRYTENRNALREMCDDMPGVNVSTMQIGYSDIDLRTEHEVYLMCRASADYEPYINKYPGGKHVNTAREMQQRLLEERRMREQRERERRQREEQQKREKEERERLERKEKERRKTTKRVINWASVGVGCVVWAATGGFGWGLLVVLGGIGITALYYSD